MKKFKIVFLCSDNIARSLIAEYCLKKYLESHNIEDIEVSSAGTDVSTDISKYCFAHFEELENLGIDISKHKRTQLTKKIIDESDLIIPMAQYHKDFVKNTFDADSIMFSELLHGRAISYHIPPPDTKECEIVLRNLVHELNGSIPQFVEIVRKNYMKGIT